MSGRHFRVIRGQSSLPQEIRNTWPASIPWELVEKWREQIELNHGQTLERLNERGGLAPEELWCAAHGCDLRPILRGNVPEVEAGKWLALLLSRVDGVLDGDKSPSC